MISMHQRPRRTSSWLILGLLSTTMISSAGYTTPAQDILLVDRAQEQDMLIEHSLDENLQETPLHSDQTTAKISITIVSGVSVQELVHQDTIELFEELKAPSEIESYIVDPEDQVYSTEVASELEDFLNNW